MEARHPCCCLPTVLTLVCSAQRWQNSSKPLTVFREPPSSRGGPHSASRHATPYHVAEDSYPGILPTGTPNGDGTAFIAPYPQQEPCKHCYSTKAHCAGRGNSLRCAYPTPSQASQRQPQLHVLLPVARNPVVSLFRCQLCCVTQLLPVRRNTQIYSPQLESPQQSTVWTPPLVNPEFYWGYL